MKARVHQHGVRVGTKLIVLHRHANQKQGQLFNLEEHASLILVLVRAKTLPNQMHVGLVDVVRRDEVHLELEKFQEFFLAGKDLLLREGSMRDFF